MKQTLKEHHVKLLREVISNRCPELANRVESNDVSGLLKGERLVIIDALSSELMATGLDKEYEPTQRGLALEELIDVVNRSNLQKSGQSGN